MSNNKSKYLYIFCLLFLGIILITALGAPFFAPYNPVLLDNPAETKFNSPSKSNLFGTDQFGRDVFSRVIYGGRISLLLSISVVFFASLFGIFYGSLASYVGGFFDNILMWFVDVFLSFPALYLIIITIALFGHHIILLIAVLSITCWMDIARLVRGEIYSLKEQPFILNAKSIGLGPVRIVLRHLLPNVLKTIIAIVIIRLADVILIESALSFIGLGVQPPVASWGSVIGDGRMVISTAWWISFFPGIFIVLTILSLYVVGNSLKNIEY